MKNLLIIFSLLLTSISWSKDVDYNDLVFRDGLYYEKYSEKPFTGKVTGLNQGKLKKGKEVGEWVYYYSNGQLSGKNNFKKGELHGKYISYFKNGKLHKKGNYKNGEKTGEYISYYENGQLRNKGSYKRSCYDGYWERYFEDGKLWYRDVYKNCARTYKYK